MRRTPRTILVLAVATLALALGAGTAAAHGGFGGGGGLKGIAKALASKKALEADVAKRLGTTTAKLNDAIKSAAKAQIDAAVEDDDITADEGAALKEAIDDGSLSAQGLGRASVVAKALGVTTSKLNDAYREARQAQAVARVDQAVKDGDLTDDEAADLKKEIEDADFPGYSGGRGFGLGPPIGFELGGPAGQRRLPSLINLYAVEGPQGGLSTRVGRGKTLTKRCGCSYARLMCARSNRDIAFTVTRGAPMTPVTHAPVPTDRRASLRPELAAAAGYLGLGRAELRERLQHGETLSALARERQRPLTRLIETMVAIARARLDAAVAAGRLTARARDDIVHDLRERIHTSVGRPVPFPEL